MAFNGMVTDDEALLFPHRVHFPHHVHFNDSFNFYHWAKENIKGEWCWGWGDVLLKEESDAILVKLTWT